MDNCGKPQSIAAILRACSACAGDYEDPDGGRTGAPDESGGDEWRDEAEYLAEEFPA